MNHSQSDNIPLEIFQYNITNFKELLSRKSGSSLLVINEKLHSSYFEAYFQELKAETIIVENDYIDRDYLEDFAGYYVKCFKNYSRKCTRLHFFNTKFTKRSFNNLLKHASNFTKKRGNLQESYLGFIIVKPLPRTIIGRTCLKTYPMEGRRHFPSIRHYDVNLFGIDLYINSLAFQEQDSVAAACATSALWSVFNATGKLYHHPIKSPVEITKIATHFSEHITRSLPNKEGLTGAQMAYAIRSVSLDPYLVNIRNEHILKGTIYAYLRGKIPLLMGVFMYDEKDSSNPKYIGQHAVAVCGYSLDLENSKAQPFEETGFLLKATRIDKIYAHDDQVGPFARMVFDGQREKKNVTGSKGELIKVIYAELLDEQKYLALSTSWCDCNGKAIAELLIAPLYNKIRIPFETVHYAVFYFDQFIEALKTLKAIKELDERLEWDIYLTGVNEIKKDLLNSEESCGGYFRNIFLENMPRYIWRATAYFKNKAALDMLFDATDIEQGAFFIRAIEYDKKLAYDLRLFYRTDNKNIINFLGDKNPKLRILFESIVSWFKSQPIEVNRP